MKSFNILVPILKFFASKVDEDREIRISAGAFTWMLGHFRNPLHPQSLRMIDLQPGTTFVTVYQGSPEAEFTLLNQPYYLIRHIDLQDHDVLLTGWWAKVRWHYRSSEYIFEEDRSLEDLGIVRSFPDPYPTGHWFTPYRYALLQEPETPVPGEGGLDFY